MDSNRKNHRAHRRFAAQHNDFNIDQSLPGYLFNLDSSLSFDIENNISEYRGETSSSPLPDNGFRQPIIPPFGSLEQDLSSGGSRHNLANSANSCDFEIGAEELQRVRSVSFSGERSAVSSDRDDGIFGASCDSSTYRPRSASFVENGFSSFSESDQSTGSPKKYSSRTVSWRRASVRTFSRSSVDEECVYCKSIGAEFHGHNNKHCPALFKLNPCSVCGASGIYNHTKNHCPSNAKELLNLKSEFSARIGENIKRRTRQRQEEQRHRDSFNNCNENRGPLNNTRP